MQIQVLGSGQEVGKSAILVSGKGNVMLDYGVKLQPEPPTYPIKPDKKLDAIIISHAHLDHSGGIPALFRKQKPDAFMTDVTLDLAAMLLKDSIKVARKNGYGAPFGENEIKKMIRDTRPVSYGEKFRAGGFSCQLFDSGHIPGSASVMLKAEKSLLYTADIQTEDSYLLRKSHLPEKTDILITESTYSYKDHPFKKSEEKRFLESVESILAKHETALIPVFAIGRAQEVLMILEKYADKIALDGMAKQASEIIAANSHYLRDPKRLKKILKKVHWIGSKEERAAALKNFPIIVSSAGMLGGGPAVHYLREIARHREKKVMFTGFLVEDSPGANMIRTKIFQNAEESFHVKCGLEQYEMSAHAGKSGLFEIIERLKPEQVICVHGEKCEQFAKDIENELGIQAHAPKNGEVVRV